MTSDIPIVNPALPDSKVFKAVSLAAAEMGRPVYVVGGYVRDLALQIPCKDLDFVIAGSGIELAERTALILGVKKVNFYKNFGTAAFRYQDFDLEFVGARKESYNRDSRKPTVEDGTLTDDQNRRDFTINAMAISLNKQDFGDLVDPFNGMHDLREGVIKTPLEPNVTYSDDPLRMLRAIRFATRLNFTIEENSYNAISTNAHRLKIVSQERITDELNKIILCKKPSRGFKLLFNTGLLELIFPEMVRLFGVEEREGISHKDNFYHTLQVLDNISEHTDKLFLRWASILHDIAKPPTKKFDKQIGWTFHGHEYLGNKMVPGIFKRLRLPLDANMKYVQKMVLLHLRPIALTKEEISDSALRRLLFEAGEDIDDLITLCRADITSKNEEKVSKYLKRYDLVVEKLKEVEERDKLRNWQPPISGEEIMRTFNLKPSRKVGIIKDAIREAILEGEIQNDYAEARIFMLRLASNLGLNPV
ncbi:MAG: CCA tRNA nucleotidyltransferase [Flavobacteriales bacterium]